MYGKRIQQPPNSRFVSLLKTQEAEHEIQFSRSQQKLRQLTPSIVPEQLSIGSALVFDQQSVMQ
jgi:hypothetical protein